VRQVALDMFPTFSKPLEGWTNYMDLDIKGLVTIGMGDLIDPWTSDIASLPWLNDSDDSPTDPDHVKEQWDLVKSRTDLAQLGGGHFKGLTDVHLSDDGIKQVIAKRLALNEDQFRQTFPSYDDWPADAHLAINSFAWGRGPALPGMPGTQNYYPKFTAALQENPPNFNTAADECIMNPQVGTIILRNDANVHLFKDAAITQQNNLDPDHLSFTGWDGRTAQWDDPNPASGGGGTSTFRQAVSGIVGPAVVARGGGLGTAFVWIMGVAGLAVGGSMAYRAITGKAGHSPSVLQKRASSR